MKCIICSIKDDMIGFMNPFIQHNEMEAERTLRTLVNDPASQINKNPGDYSIWTLGKFDDQTGEIEPNKPEMIVKAISIKGVEK